MVRENPSAETSKYAVLEYKRVKIQTLKVFFMNIIMLLFRRVKASVVLLMRAPTGMLQLSAVHADCRIFPQFFSSRHLEAHPGIPAITALL